MDHLQLNRNREHIFPIIILVLFCILISLSTIHYGYLLEDYVYLRSYSLNEVITTFYSHWEPSLAETRGYRPLHSVHFALLYFLIGGDPVLNHLLHIALFIAGILILYYFTFRCTQNNSTSFWTSFTFACLGAMAWQVSWLVNRQHLFQVIFFLGMLTGYDCYLISPSKKFWIITLVFFVLALLLKETAVTYPIIAVFFAIIVRRKKLRSQIKPLALFFLILILFLIIRTNIVKTLPEENTFPPPPSLQPATLVREYSRSILCALVQTQGIHDPRNDFPIYFLGLKTARDYLGLLSLSALYIFGGILLYPRMPEKSRRTFIFGLSVLFIASVMVAAWLRTNRVFISSIGVALMTGILASELFNSLSFRNRMVHITGRLLLLACFCVYIFVNLWVFIEIKDALQPNGFLATTWDNWAYEEYIPWMKEEQIRIFDEKLRRSGREEWADKLSERIEGTGSKR